MDRDRMTVGLAPDTQDVLARIMSLGWFADGQDVARLALAIAVRRKVRGGVASDTDTRWGVGNFDHTGEIRSLLSATYPDCQTPVRLMEHLVNEGLRILVNKIGAPDLTPDGLLE